MDSNFALLSQAKKTNEYISKQLVNYPKTEMVLKQNIEKNMYEIIELIFSYKINLNNRIKMKYLKDLVIKLSMLDYYINISYEKKVLSRKKTESISGLIINLRKIVYGVIRSVE